MSVIGFDIGNVNCVIAVAKRGGIDVLLNDEAKRESPAVVSFGDKQRFLGSAGAAFATANPKSTISQIKRLIGRQYKELSVQEELKLLPFVTSEGPRGDLQRREYLDAAAIAGLKPLRLMHDGTAIALGYGMYKTDLSDVGPTIVV
nr:heat shock 70 kDa protein 16 [Tanacetum cinerariifolium]